MKYEFIQLALTDSIATLTLNRAEKRNAMHGPMIKELLQALETVALNSDAQLLLIHANGEHFCAGADIGWMQKIATGSYEENYDDAQLLADLMYQLYTFPKPTIVLAHGATLGGGLGLLSACDIALAAKGATFGFPEVKMGIVPSVISPYVITAIGERIAHYYFLTGERFGAEEAYRIGLIHQFTEPQALQSTGLTLAKKILENSTQALHVAKQLIRHVAKQEITEALAQKTAEHLANLRSTPEAQAKLRAFFEKKTS